MFKSLLAAVALLAVGSQAAAVQCKDATQTLPPGPYCPPFKVTPEQQRAIFERFTKLFLVTGQFRTAFLEHVAETYIQHNPFFLSGRQVVLDAFGNDTADPAAAGYPANIITQAFDAKREIGMFHYYFTPQNGTQPSITVDIFRMNGPPREPAEPARMFTPPK